MIYDKKNMNMRKKNRFNKYNCFEDEVEEVYNCGDMFAVKTIISPKTMLAIQMNDTVNVLNAPNPSPLHFAGMSTIKAIPSSPFLTPLQMELSPLCPTMLFNDDEYFPLEPITLEQLMGGL